MGKGRSNGDQGCQNVSTTGIQGLHERQEVLQCQSLDEDDEDSIIGYIIGAKQ
jgi:hypothetical protein